MHTLAGGRANTLAAPYRRAAARSSNVIVVARRSRGKGARRRAISATKRGVMSEARARHNARALQLEHATSARIAMRAGTPPPNAYAQFAYSAIERAARDPGPPPASPPQLHHRARRERDPRSDLRPRPFSLPRHFRAPPPVPARSQHLEQRRFEHRPAAWAGMRRAQHPPAPPPTSSTPMQMPRAPATPPPQRRPPYHERALPPPPMYPYAMRSQPAPRQPPPVSHAAPSRHAPAARPRSSLPHEHRLALAHHHSVVSAACPPAGAAAYFGALAAPAAARTFYAMMDGRDPHRQKVKYVSPSFANQRTYLAVCGAGVASIRGTDRVYRPGEVVAGSLVFEYAQNVGRADAPIVDVPQVWVCCEVAKRQVNSAFCGAMPAPPEDISELPVPHGHRPFVYHHYVDHRQDHGHVGLAHARYNHCSDLIRGDNGAPFRVPTVTSQRAVDARTVAFDFEFVLPDDLPHSYSWQDTAHGAAAFVDIRYRLLVSMEVQPRAGCTHSAPSAELSSSPSRPSYSEHAPFVHPFFAPPAPPYSRTHSSPRAASSHAPPSTRTASVGSVPSWRAPSAAPPADAARYMVVCESYLLVASPVMPNPHIYLASTDPRLSSAAPKCATALVNQQTIRIELLDAVTQLDRPLTVRVVVVPAPHATTVNVRCGIEETVTFGASPLKRATCAASVLQMRQPVVAARAQFVFTLAPPSELLYPTAVVGPLAVRHWVVASVVDYAAGDRLFAATTVAPHAASPPRPRLHAELPLALQPSVTPLDPNPAAHALAAPVPLAHAPLRAGAHVVPPTLQADPPAAADDQLVQLRNVWVRRRSAPHPASGAAAAAPPGVSAVKLLKYGKRAKQSEDDACPICMTEIEVDSQIATLSCDHEGHGECMQNMVEFSRKNRKDVLCPICRRRAEPV